MFFAFLAGVLLKLYDDLVVDNSILKEPHAVVTLRTLLVAVATLYLSEDFWICLAFTFIVFTTYLSDPGGYGTPHERSFAAIAPLLLIVSWSKRTPVVLLDCVGILVSGVITGVEPHIFPEETSVAKMVFRSALAAAALLSMYYVPSELFITRSLFSFAIGYVLTSSLFQMLVLNGLIQTQGTADPSIQYAY